jgi:hypothetical protein
MKRSKSCVLACRPAGLPVTMAAASLTRMARTQKYLDGSVQILEGLRQISSRSTNNPSEKAPINKYFELFISKTTQILVILFYFL